LSNVFSPFRHYTFDEAYGMLSETNRKMLENIIAATREKRFSDSYDWLMRTNAKEFGATGNDIDGFDGEETINLVLAYYEGRDTVEGYKRCIRLKKLLDKYKKRFADRFLVREEIKTYNGPTEIENMDQLKATNDRIGEVILYKAAFDAMKKSIDPWKYRTCMERFDDLISDLQDKVKTYEAKNN